MQVTFGPVTEVGVACSPDGKRIAFEYFHPERPANPQLWLMPSDGGFSAAEPIVDDMNFNGGPSWSPDSQWIAYVKHYPTKKADARTSSQVFKINVRTRLVVQLTSLPEFSVVGGTTSWSKDGWIAFRWNGDIYRVSEKGGEAELIAAVRSGSLSVEPSNLSWAPDGKRIAFVADDSRAEHQGISSIWIFDLEGKALQRITEGHMDWFPSWRDNDSLVFGRMFSTKKGAIFSMNIRTRKANQLTAGAIDVAPAIITSTNELLFSRSTEIKPGHDFQLFRGFHVWRKQLPSNGSVVWLYRGH